MNMWGWSEKRLLLLVFVSYAVFVVNSSTLSLGRCRQAVQSCHLYSFVAQVLVQICQVNVGCTDFFGSGLDYFDGKFRVHGFYVVHSKIVL